MRLKLDENVPESLLNTLAVLGHDVDSVRSERLSGRSDLEIWQAAQTTSRILVTQDLDFSDLRRFAPGSHKGLILVRLRVPGRLALSRRLLEVFGSGPTKSWEGCFVLITDRKVRVHSP